MKIPNHHTTRIEKTGHYSTLGVPNNKVKYIWIICHGYGQLAKHIIHKFSSIQSDEHFFIAPEGLSRFYWNEAKGQVGASWMTKENRLEEIDDYTAYLQQLHDQYKAQCSPNVKVIAFGFSQGVATVWRWIMAKQPNIHSLVMWAGLTPEDIDYLPYQKYLGSIYTMLIYGGSDEYLTEERMAFQRTFEKEQQLKIQYRSFEGKHEVKREVLVSLLDIILSGEK